MKRMLLLLSLVLALLHGCVMVKIGGVKSTERSELSRNLQETRMESLVSIEPRLTQSGELTLWVSGRFWDTYNVRNKITEYGDEWMAIGLFPGYDSFSNGYSDKEGKKLDPLGCVIVPAVCNCLLCGIYTVVSLLEFLDPNPIRLHSGDGIAKYGLVGSVKYEGAKYELKTYEKGMVDVKSDDKPRLLKDYCIVIDDKRMNDKHGVFSLGRGFKSGDVVDFRIVTAPQSLKANKDVFAPFIGQEFKVICK